MPGHFAAPGGPVWISDNGADQSTIYNASTGSKIFGITLSPGAPTGTVYVPPGSGFNISKGANSGPAEFLFDPSPAPSKDGQSECGCQWRGRG